MGSGMKAFWLWILIVGGLVWGIYGVTSFASMNGFNLISWLVGFIPSGLMWIDSVVYTLVGVSAVMVAFAKLK